MLIYQSLDAVIAHKEPSGVLCECGAYDWMRRSESIDKPPAGYGHELRAGWWECIVCKDTTNRWLYVNRRESLWTIKHVQIFRQARRDADKSLKDVAALTNVPVSRLSDFERRHAAPNEDEMNALKSIFVLWE